MYLPVEKYFLGGSALPPPPLPKCLPFFQSVLTSLLLLFHRRECEKVATYLRSKNISAQPYHAGLKDKERIHVHENWLQDTFKVFSSVYLFLTHFISSVSGSYQT